MARLPGKRPIVLGGSTEAVQLFYDEARFRRAGAMPRFVRRTLFGEGAVHGLDDEQHALRKAMFLELVTPDAAQAIGATAAREWTELVGEAAVPRVELFATAVGVHADAVCDWARVPADLRYPALAGDLATIVDGFGSIGLRHVRAARARKRVDRWSTRLIRAVRAGVVKSPPHSALARMSTQRDVDGKPLDAEVAGVELVNILRPTVAVAWFAVFAAMALHDHPELRARLADGDNELLESFAHELRRAYPFVPMLAARARTDFEWKGHRFRRGQRVVLNVYGTLHDPHVWHEPDHFDVGRFRAHDPDPYLFIPQGGGMPEGHRCPGERVAVELIKETARWLCCVDYEVPAQDLRLRLARMPARPRHGFVMTDVRRRTPARPGPAAVPA